MSQKARQQRPIGAHKDTSTLPDWALGPFFRDEEPILTPTTRGWEAGRIFNMSLLKDNDKMFCFYRGTPREVIDQPSAIGLAWGPSEWELERHVHNPIIEPTATFEEHGCEDPKLYKYDNRYVLFYNPVWKSEGVWQGESELNCNIAVATSADLIHWEKHGQLVPAKLSGGWAKGAVIPRNGAGRPVKIDGEFLMYVGELGSTKSYQLVGRSTDLVNWEFERQTFLEPMPSAGVEGIHEPATIITDLPGRPDDMIMTFNYEPSKDLDADLHLGNARGQEYPPCGQVLIKKSDPFTPVDFAPEPAGSWGGIIRHGDEWVFGDQEGGYLARTPVEE